MKTTETIRCPTCKYRLMFCICDERLADLMDNLASLPNLIYYAAFAVFFKALVN